MSTEFIAGRLWPQVTQAARQSRQRCAVAVAYFGQGASRLLPLPKGSRLVVDASEGTVKSGQTCPAELLAMIKCGVRVYSVANLHAKVFVLGRVAFVGSANVSRRSAGTLIEAAVRMTDSAVLRKAREFVLGKCLHEQTPEQLKRLAKLYHPPQLPGGEGRRKRAKITVLPRLSLVQLVLQDWSKRDQALHDAAEVVAKKRREHPRSYELDSFRWTGKCPFKRGDVVIQITDEGSAGRLMAAPGNVLHVRTRSKKSRLMSFVYVERPARRRRQTKTVARKLGRGAVKQLRRGGLVRNAAFREALLKLWSD